MPSTSLAIAGIAANNRIHAAYPAPSFVPAPADSRTTVPASPLPGTPPSEGTHIRTLSESVRDRVTITARVSRSPVAEKATRRAQPRVRPAGRDNASQSLSGMADAVSDRVTLTQRATSAAKTGATYTSRGIRADIVEVPSAELENMAAGVTDQVTLTGDAPGMTLEPGELTVYIAGNGRFEPERPSEGGFPMAALLPLPG